MILPRKIFFLTLVLLVACIGPVISKKASADTIGSRGEIIRVIQESTQVAQAASKSAGLPDFQPGAVIQGGNILITSKGQEILSKISQQQKSAVLIEESTKVAQAASKSAGLPDFQAGAVVTTNGIQITSKGQDVLKSQQQSQQPLASVSGGEKKAVLKEKPQDLIQKLGSISDILKEEGQANAVPAPVIEDEGNDKGSLNNLLAISIFGFSGKRSWSLIIGLILIVAAIFITMPKKKKSVMQDSSNTALQSKVIDNKIMLKK